MVMQNASTISESRPVLVRMKAMPCFMLSKIDSVDRAGMNPTRITYSETITAMNERPFSPKHHAALSLASATPASVGPITRARLNWMEFHAIAFG